MMCSAAFSKVSPVTITSHYIIISFSVLHAAFVTRSAQGRGALSSVIGERFRVSELSERNFFIVSLVPLHAAFCVDTNYF